VSILSRNLVDLFFRGVSKKENEYLKDETCGGEREREREREREKERKRKRKRKDVNTI